MAELVRLRALIVAIILLVIVAAVMLTRVGSSGPPKQVAVRPTLPAISTEARATELLRPSPQGTPRVHAIEVTGARPEDAIALQTVSDGARGRTVEQVITWRAGGVLKTQHFPAVPYQGPIARPNRGALFGPFQDESSSVIEGFEQIQNGQRELGIIYDATAYGSGSPTAHFALLRLQGDSWRIIWDVKQSSDWRGSHGRIDFPNGDLSELVVHSDDFSEGADQLSGVIFEANAGPHRAFVDTWIRQGDGYVRQSAETVPSAYATLVMFLYDLAHGDDAGARALVTDAALVNTARSLGLDGWKGKYWLLACPNTGGPGCGWDSGPVSFYQGPPVAISFVEQDGQWLISDITKRP